MINLIFDNEEIDVDKDTLMKFEYFRNLFEISENNIKIENIDADIFKVLICMMKYESDIVEKAAILSDFLGCKTVCQSLINYRCAIVGCNNISLNKLYCVWHKCKVDGCIGGNSNHGYCNMHRCIYAKCENIKYINFQYCILHKCSIDECVYGATLNYKFCSDHSCYSDYCPNEQWIGNIYCYTHLLEHNGGSSNICRAMGCNNVKYRWGLYCVKHG